MGLERELEALYRQFKNGNTTPTPAKEADKWVFAGAQYNLDDYVLCFEHTESEVTHTVLVQTDYTIDRLGGKDLDGVRLRFFADTQLERGSLEATRLLPEHATVLHRQTGDASTKARNARGFVSWVTRKLENLS